MAQRTLRRLVYEEAIYVPHRDHHTFYDDPHSGATAEQHERLTSEDSDSIEIVSITNTEPVLVEDLTKTMSSRSADVAATNREADTRLVLGDYTFEIADVEGIEDTASTPADSLMADTSITVASAIYDLQAYGLSAPGGQPYPCGTPIKFTYYLTNNSSSTVYNVKVWILDNGVELGYLPIGEMAAGVTYQCTTDLTGNIGGNHTIEFVINRDRAIPESNYNNNTASGTFIWAGLLSSADIGLRNMASGYGTTFVCRQTNTFTVQVVNYGPATSNFNISFFIQGMSSGSTDGSTITVYNLQPGYGTTISASVDMLRAQNHYVEFSYTAPIICPDPDTSDNRAQMSVTTTMDKDLFAGKWSNAQNLCVSVYQNARDLYTGSDTTMGSAIKAWNGVTSYVSLALVTYYDNNYGDIGDITVSTYIRPGDFNFTRIAAVTRLFTYGAVEITNPITDSSMYTYAMVLFNADTDGFSDLSTSEQSATITHEIGHVFGLMHPHDQSNLTCANDAIMWHRESDYRTGYITEHDRFNLWSKYN